MRKKLCALFSALTLLCSCVATSGCSIAATDGVVANIGTYPATLDPALSITLDGGNYIRHMLTGLISYDVDENGKIVTVPACAKEIPEPVALEDGKVSYTFTLRDDLYWSDGSPVTADDFVYSWNRVADPLTGADYSYLFDCIDGYEDVQNMYLTEADEEGNVSFVTDENGNYVYADGRKSLNVKASEDGKTLEVVLLGNTPYFMQLCAFPTFMPVNREAVEKYGEAWATKRHSYISNGPYVIKEFTLSKLVLEKNEYYYDKENVTGDILTFTFNEDDSSSYANFQSGAYHFINRMPVDEIEAIKEKYGDRLITESELGIYYVCFNANDPTLDGFTEDEKMKLRKAMSLLIDRNYVCAEIGKSGQIPANGFVPAGLTEYDGEQYISRNGENGDGSGYFSIDPQDYAQNCEQALLLLKEVSASSGKFTVENDKAVGFPTMTYITNSGSAHEVLAEYLQSVWGNYGIPLKVEIQEWATFVSTRQSGNYSIARNGWIADYNDPISFLDLCVSSSGNNDAKLGNGEHAKAAVFSFDGQDGLTWAEAYDECIAQIKAETDQVRRFELMHKAEDMLMQTGALVPIYCYAHNNLVSDKLEGFYTTPLGELFLQKAVLKD